MHFSWITVLWVPILSVSIFTLPGTGSHVSPLMNVDVPVAASKVQEHRSKLFLLESVLEAKSNTLKQKHAQLEVKGQMVEKVVLDMQSLRDAVSTIKKIKDGPEEERVNGLKEKVHLLWDESRKNNFQLRVLEEQAQDCEVELEALTSRVQKLKDIVTEQWIQIQRLEQALLMAKMKVVKEPKKYNYYRWSFSQAIMNFSTSPFQNFRSIVSGTRLGETVHHLRRFFSYIQYYHFVLQHFLRCALESHDSTVALAHDEIVFFLVSATLVFPLLAMLRFLVGYLMTLY